MSSRFVVLAALAAALSFAGLAASAPPAKPPGPFDLVKKGLAQAVADGRLDQPLAAGYLAVAKKAVTLQPKLPPARAEVLRDALADVAAQWRSYLAPRALTLFSMLEFNERELSAHPLPASGADRFGEDG